MELNPEVIENMQLAEGYQIQLCMIDVSAILQRHVSVVPVKEVQELMDNLLDRFGELTPDIKE